MLLRPRRARDLRVRDVTDEQVAEDVLALLSDGRAPLPAHELLPLEPVQEQLGFAPVPVADPLERAEPEDLADDGRVLEQELLLDRKRIEARGDDSLHRLGEPEAAPVLAELVDHARELLGVERVAPGALDQRGLNDRPEGQTRSSRAWTRRAVSSSESGESEIVAAFGLPPPQPGRRERSSGRAVQTTSIGTPAAQSTRWSMKSSRLSSAQWRSSKTSTSGLRSASASRNLRQAANASAWRSLPHVLRLGQADEGPEVALDPLPVGRAFQDLRDDAAEPLLDLIRRVGLEDARVGFHHLAQGPVRDAFAVGQASALAPVDEVRLVLQR